MAEGEKNGADKALEVIPLFFFDLIARVVPGLFLLFGLDLLCGGELLRKFFAAPLPEEARGSAFVLSASALLAGYVVGHFMSPLVKQFDNWYKDSAADQNLNRSTGNFGHRCRHFVARCWHALFPKRQNKNKSEDKPEQRGYGEMYDWLRLLCPGVTNIIMRIRAEYIMYGGFCLALGILGLTLLSIGLASFFHAILGSSHDIAPFTCVLKSLEAVALLVGSVIMFQRNQATIRTF